MSSQEFPFPYPRRHVQRYFLRGLAYVVFGLLLDLQIEGWEHVPKRGPLLVVCNHFNGLDAALVVRVAPWLLEFLADFEMPNVPGWMKFITDVWGTFPVNENNASRSALRAAEATLAQNGVVMIFPEGRLGEPVLRPPKPGVAFLAARSGAPVLPMAIVGSTEVFAAWRKL
ncbi:MAG: 1-acyl-sn-glycerol-3-phosphate acyltransferase, partial [Anaerolineales bacterium]|nr:1-acyl-sn-glycerol-3-phosphate acyltransferase [Anaerolineales bacterium]